MRFEFATATQIIFGPGTLKDIGVPAAEMGHHGFVITGRNLGRAAPLVEQLKKQGLVFAVQHTRRTHDRPGPCRRRKSPP
jgi:alcohol dehydrogenase class IV